MTPSELATLAIVAALVIERILERKDRRRDSALRDAAAANDLKDDYTTELERRVKRLEDRLEQRDGTINSMRTALRWFFDELASSDRCKRASAGCQNRIPPGEFPEERMAQIRELLEDPVADQEE